ncbi:MAG: hypothetical protein IJU95_09370 [Treponema sp.]|nr:hypothetical protein [Treponema sp.]
MYKYRILKFFFLTALYSAVIIGVFILQFKTETVISRNIGGMELSLSSSKDKDNNDILRNRFRIGYEGLTFSSEESSPALARISGQEEPEPLVLESWAKNSGNEINLRFGGGASVSFTSNKSNANVSAEGASSGPLLTITAELPENYESISIPYNISNSYNISLGQGQGKDDSGSLTLQRGEEYFKLSGPAFNSESTTGLVTLAKSTPAAFYTAFVPVREFQFESVAELPLTDEASYSSTKAALKRELRRKFQAALDAKTTLTEKAVVAYIADMTEDSKFNIAINSIPSSFKNSSSRSYLSTPYLANVIPLSGGLRRKDSSLTNSVKNAASNKDPSFFSLDGLSDWLLIHKLESGTKEALAIPAALDESQLTLRDAAAIISVYTALDSQDASFADNLGASIEKCLSVIRKHLTLDGTNIIVGKRQDTQSDSSEEPKEEKELSQMERILLGQTLRGYGDTIGDNSIMEAGNLLVNQELRDVSALSLDEISELYPRIITENRYYPHVQVLGYYGKKPVWAWTCAPNIDYKVAPSGTTDINIDFTLSYTHYVTFMGVPTFHNKIQIQNLDFHTDKNYEMWNSSGFVYDEPLQAFYLKSRHKSKLELIRLFCDPAPLFVSVTHPAK